MDWKNIIQSLLSDGMTQAQIAKAVGVAQPTISGLLSGAQRDMRWESGNRLISLYRQNCKSSQGNPLDVGPLVLEEPHMPNTPDPKPDDRIPIDPPDCITKGGVHV